MAVDCAEYTERMPSSTVRHSSINQARTGAGTAPLYPRASRKRQELLEELTTRQYQERRMTQAPETDADEVIAPSTRSGCNAPRNAPPQRPAQQSRHNATHLFLLLAGMLIVLVLFFFGVRISAWFMNTFHDPSYYTQTAHLDTIIVTDAQGQPNQARAFVDVKGHIDIVVIPNGDPTKARIVVGPAVTGIADSQHAIVTVNASGTIVAVTIQGPYTVNWFTASQQTYQWSYDISQKQQGG